MFFLGEAIVSDKPAGALSGVLAIGVISGVSMWVASLPAVATLRVSPLIVGILLGVCVGNLAGERLPSSWGPGVTFSAKKILRLAIVLFGFRITFGQIADLGMAGVLLDVFMVSSTLVLGVFFGTRFLGLDRETAILTSAGAAICGAAAVIAAEPVVKAEPHKTTVAVGTVVLFGTLSMFLYPIVFRAGLLPMSEDLFGVYIGASVHEVAHVVGAGSAVSEATANTAVIVKMTRVMLLAPALLCISWWLGRAKATEDVQRPAMSVPWFAVGFVAVAGFNSLALLPEEVVGAIDLLDTFFLTMAMTALGMGTVGSKLKGVGWSPLLLALALFVWLVGAGYLATTWLMG